MTNYLNSLRSWYQTQRFYFRRRVGRTVVGDELVSTVFIGVPGFYIEQPYETMVFGDYDDGVVRRYKTRKAAKEGHWRIVNQLRQDLYQN